jgi:hypothetical protein
MRDTELSSRRRHPAPKLAAHYRDRAIQIVSLLTASGADERLCRQLVVVAHQYLGIADSLAGEVSWLDGEVMTPRIQ